MTEEEARQIWADYHERLKQRRLAEADRLWSAMTSAGVGDETVLALDFRIVCRDEASGRQVEQQLSETYTINLTHDAAENIWLISGTTRPTGVTLDKETHSDWVAFMADTAARHGGFLASWMLEAPKLGLVFESETIETDLP